MNMKYYPDTSSSPDFSLLEKEIIKFWQENKIFEQSVEKRSKDNCFVFYDGPPFANGLPHYGHLLTGFIKDAFARYQTMLEKELNADLVGIAMGYRLRWVQKRNLEYLAELR